MSKKAKVSSGWAYLPRPLLDLVLTWTPTQEAFECVRLVCHLWSKGRKVNCATPGDILNEAFARRWIRLNMHTTTFSNCTFEQNPTPISSMALCLLNLNLQLSTNAPGLFDILSALSACSKLLTLSLTPSSEGPPYHVYKFARGALCFPLSLEHLTLDSFDLTDANIGTLVNLQSLNLVHCRSLRPEYFCLSLVHVRVQFETSQWRQEIIDAIARLPLLKGCALVCGIPIALDAPLTFSSKSLEYLDIMAPIIGEFRALPSSLRQIGLMITNDTTFDTYDFLKHVEGMHITLFLDEWNESIFDMAARLLGRAASLRKLALFTNWPPFALDQEQSFSHDAKDCFWETVLKTAGDLEVLGLFDMRKALACDFEVLFQHTHKLQELTVTYCDVDYHVLLREIPKLSNKTLKMFQLSSREDCESVCPEYLGVHDALGFSWA